MRARWLGVLAVVVVAGLGLLLLSSSPSEEAEAACLAALHDELGLPPDEDVDPVTWRADGDQVGGEWRYGSTRASSGVMPVGRGEVTCTVSDGEVTGLDVERYAGTP